MTDVKKDSIYEDYIDKVADFVFDDKVVAVFDDMIRRSVPGYGTIIAMTKIFAERYVGPNSNCYDLGCSLGTSTLAMQRGISQPGCKIISVDNSKSMIERCREILDSEISQTPVELKHQDITDTKIENASMVVLNFTMQFLTPKMRDELIQKIYDGLLPGGILLLSEKIAFPKPDEQEFQIEMHHNFKRLNGYSNLEISQKRKAIENVLIPDTLQKHYDRLGSAGFEKYYRWFKCFNFTSLVAFKRQ